MVLEMTDGRAAPGLLWLEVAVSIAEYMPPPLGAEFQEGRSHSSIQATHCPPQRTSVRNRISASSSLSQCVHPQGRSLLVPILTPGDSVTQLHFGGNT